MRVRLAWLLSILCIGLSACAPGSNKAATAAVQTASPVPQVSPTVTIDWFPTTATPTRAPVLAPTLLPTAALGKSSPLLQDDFSDTHAWDKVQVTSGSAAYGKNEFTIAITGENTLLNSMRHAPELGNFYLEITASTSLCREADSYGLLLRAADPYNGYRWVVTCDGRTRLERLQNGYIVLLQDWLTSGDIRQGAPVDTPLAVWMYGQEMRFYIKGVEQFRVSDPVFSSGFIGVFARSSGTSPLTVSFSSLGVWSIDPNQVSTNTPSPTTTPLP